MTLRRLQPLPIPTESTLGQLPERLIAPWIQRNRSLQRSQAVEDDKRYRRLSLQGAQHERPQRTQNLYWCTSQGIRVFALLEKTSMDASGPPKSLKLHIIVSVDGVCRVDLSDLHAFEARQQYALEIQKGEAGINLAAAALAVSAEDDALVSHSTVKLPGETFLKRIEGFSADVERATLRSLPSETSPTSVLEIVKEQLFNEKQFRAPTYGRSNVPFNSILDHPGVWENASQAYLHEVLIRKKGIAATLAIIFAQIMQNLLACGAISFGVRIDCSELDRLPEARVLPGLPREALVRPDGSVLNTCSTIALRELLSFLKRSFWPFQWDTRYSDPDSGWAGGSGFRGAAEVALEGPSTATLQAIARSAKHRQDRGVWTSTGAGDMRRAKAAAERLCILAGEEDPWERRDVSILLWHTGQVSQAAIELEAYISSSYYRTTAKAGEKSLVERLLAKMTSHPDYQKGEGTLISTASTLAAARPEANSLLPLTW